MNKLTSGLSFLICEVTLFYYLPCDVIIKIKGDHIGKAFSELQYTVQI